MFQVWRNRDGQSELIARFKKRLQAELFVRNEGLNNNGTYEILEECV